MRASSGRFSGTLPSGQFLAPDGTSSAPGYGFSSSPNTGWYLASSTIRSTVGGTNAIFISGSAIGSGTDGATDLGSFTNHWKRLYIDYTNTGTVGAVTINKASGRVNLAAAGTTLTLTNSLITAASHIFLQESSAPGNAVAVSYSVVPAAGSAVITAVPAVTNQTSIDFLVINAD